MNRIIVCRGSWAAMVLALTSILSACANAGWLPSAGPSADKVVAESKGNKNAVHIQIIDLPQAIRLGLGVYRSDNDLSVAFGDAELKEYTVSNGDVLEISIWEAPPALLFGGGVPTDGRGSIQGGRQTVISDQAVSADGTIRLPFVGEIVAVKKTLKEIELEIAQRLSRMANNPQVSVRATRVASSTVTVVGEVANSIKLPLHNRQERLLDALAGAGGVKQPVSKVAVQLTRSGKSQTVSLERLIRNPSENVPLRAGDVVTVFVQPLSFTALGAVTTSGEVAFEISGINLSQALARIGGLQDNRADPKGVFLFRWVDQTILETSSDSPTVGRANQKLAPIIVRADFSDPATYFLSQKFSVNDKDLIYVSNAPAADLQKFLNIIASAVFPTATLINLTR